MAIDNDARGLAGAALGAASSATALASTTSVSFDATVPVVQTRGSIANHINSSGVMVQDFINRARFDYDLTGTLAGLLVEPYTPKIAPYSLDMNTQFTASSMTKAAGVADLFGGTNGVTLTNTAGAAAHFASSNAAALTAGTVYTVSAIIKPNTLATAIQLAGGSAAFGSASYANFDMTAAASLPPSTTVGAAYQTGVIDAKIKTLGNGYYQIWMVLPAASTGNNVIANIASVANTSAGRLASWTATGAEAVTVVAFECEAGYFPTSFLTTTSATAYRFNDYTLLNTAALGIYPAVYSARVLFDDNSTQPVKADATSGTWLIPSTLNRGRIKRVTFKPYVSRQTDLLMGIGQSNIGISGVDVGTTYYTVPSEIDDIQRFAISRGGNGDPVQSGALIPAAALRGFTELADVSGSANMPTTLMAWLANRRENRLGLTKLRRVARIDALGGIPLTYLLSGAENGTYTGGAKKYFYVNARATRQAGYTAAQALGDTFTHRIVMVHGEDTSIATDQYETYLSANLIDRHYADAVTDVGTPPASFIIMQTSGTAAGVAQQYGPLAHLAETRRRAGSTVVLAGPLYQMPLSTDGQHYQSIGKLMMADLHNYVNRQVAANGTYTPLDIARTATPSLAANQGIRSVGLTASTTITGLGTGTGGLGTYTVNNSQTVASSGSPQRFVAFGAVFDGYISGTTLTVTNIVSGALNVVVSGSTVTVTLNRPVSVDATWVPSVGSAYGFAWSDASSRTISSVAVSGSTVTLTLSGAPSGAKTLSYALDPCAAPYLISGNSGGTANWSSTRGQIYHDSGEVSDAYLQDPTAGWPTIREYLVRFQESF